MTSTPHFWRVSKLLTSLCPHNANVLKQDGTIKTIRARKNYKRLYEGVKCDKQQSGVKTLEKCQNTGRGSKYRTSVETSNGCSNVGQVSEHGTSVRISDKCQNVRQVSKCQMSVRATHEC